MVRADGGRPRGLGRPARGPRLPVDPRRRARLRGRPARRRGVLPRRRGGPHVRPRARAARDRVLHVGQAPRAPRAGLRRARPGAHRDEEGARAQGRERRCLPRGGAGGRAARRRAGPLARRGGPDRVLGRLRGRGVARRDGRGRRLRRREEGEDVQVEALRGGRWRAAGLRRRMEGRQGLGHGPPRERLHGARVAREGRPGRGRALRRGVRLPRGGGPRARAAAQRQAGPPAPRVFVHERRLGRRERRGRGSVPQDARLRVQRGDRRHLRLLGGRQRGLRVLATSGLEGRHALGDGPAAPLRIRAAGQAARLAAQGRLREPRPLRGEAPPEHPGADPLVVHAQPDRLRVRPEPGDHDRARGGRAERHRELAPALPRELQGGRPPPRRGRPRPPDVPPRVRPQRALLHAQLLPRLGSGPGAQRLARDVGGEGRDAALHRRMGRAAHRVVGELPRRGERPQHLELVGRLQVALHRRIQRRPARRGGVPFQPPQAPLARAGRIPLQGQQGRLLRRVGRRHDEGG